MEETVIYLLMIQTFSKIIGAPLCLGSISKDLLVGNMKKTGLNGYAYNFSVD